MAPLREKVSSNSSLLKSFSLLLKTKGFQSLFIKNISSYPSHEKSHAFICLVGQLSTAYTTDSLFKRFVARFLFSNIFIWLSFQTYNMSCLSSLL